MWGAWVLFLITGVSIALAFLVTPEPRPRVSTTPVREARTQTEDSVTQEPNESPGLGAGKDFLWRFPLGFTVSVEMALVDDLLLMAGSNRLYAMKVGEKTARLLWFESFEGKVRGVTGSTNGQVFVSTDGGEVCAIDIRRSSERVVWRRFVPEAALTRAGLTPDGARLYLGTSDNKLHALAANTGELLWSRELPGPVTVEPAILKDKIIVACADGTILTITGPMPADELWRFKAGAAPRSTSISGGSLYVASGDALTSIDPDLGTQTWRRILIGGVSGQVVQAGNHVFAADLEGKVRVLNVATGKTVGTYEGTGGPLRGGFVALGSTVYGGSDDKSVYAFDAETTALRWSIESEDKIRMRCVIGRGRLYFMGGGNLYALKLD